MRNECSRRPAGTLLVVVLCLCSLCLSSGSLLSAAEPLERHRFLQIRMGVPFEILVYAPTEEAANQAAEAAYARIRELDRIMSDYDPDSELMQLCAQARPGEPHPVSPDLFETLQAAREISVESDGAFDVTVGPVVRLWRVARRGRTLPDPAELKSALTRVGTSCWSLDPERRTVALHAPGMRFDLGGIAKGRAADEALAVLRAHGLGRALVDASGDVVAGDPPPGQAGWRIEIEQPGRLAGAAPRILLLSGASVCTSGDAYQHVEIDGVRYSHIVDPRTGIGLTTPGNVTVIAPTGSLADALASAVSVLGSDDGLKLIEKYADTEALVVQEENGRLVSGKSSGWERHMSPEQ